MTSNNICPYCGSEEDPELTGRFFRKYKCDSTQLAGGDGKTVTDQSEDCMRIELSALRIQNRDLQQAYDHVLECEQNRCREVVDLQDKLAEVTAEWDSVSTQLHDELVLTARLKCDFVNMKNELADIKATIEAAPIGKIVGFHDGCILDVELDEGEQVVLFNRVRLLRDPEEPNA